MYLSSMVGPLGGGSCRVAFSLLPVAEQSAVWPATAGPFRPLTCVQLKSRHWIIRTKQDQETEEVQGDGVVGEFPILTPGSHALAPSKQSGRLLCMTPKSAMQTIAHLQHAVPRVIRHCDNTFWVWVRSVHQWKACCATCLSVIRKLSASMTA